MSKKEEWMLKDQTKEKATHVFQKIDVKKEILKMVIYVLSRRPSSGERFFFLERRLMGLNLTPTGGSLYEDGISMVKVLLTLFFPGLWPNSTINQIKIYLR